MYCAASYSRPSKNIDEKHKNKSFEFFVNHVNAGFFVTISEGWLADY